MSEAGASGRAAVSLARNFNLLVGALVIHQRRPGLAQRTPTTPANTTSCVATALTSITRQSTPRPRRSAPARRLKAPSRAAIEALRHRHARASGEYVGDRVGAGAQRIDAEHLVLAQDRRDLAAPVEADQQVAG